MLKRALTGIKPTGSPHLGNYLGAIKPSIELSRKYDAFYFVADYHALTTLRDAKELNRLSHEVAAAWLALGLDASKVVFYRQSAIPEVFELTWILTCLTSKGLLNRAHAYKALVDRNTEEGKDPDYGVNAGLFNYPALMAADILIFKANFVPVGQDQKQHVEIARDVAQAFNHSYGKILTLPEPLIPRELAALPGIDGRKMSKNYDNTIPLFAPAKQVKKRIMRIVTDSKTPEEPKDPEQCNVFNIYRHFGEPRDVEQLADEYRAGGVGYARVKNLLHETLMERFSGPRARYEALMADQKELDGILREGAERARMLAGELMARIRKAVGIWLG